MALPTPVTKQHMDEAGDDPKLARAELAALADALNALLTHLGLSTITSQPLTVGEALEAVSGALRVKLDGSTLARSASGLKLNVPVSIANGGTGAGDATQARANLGLGALATKSTVGSGDISSGAVLTAAIGNDQVTDAKLSHVNSNVGTFTNATVTVNAQGRVTSASSGSSTPPANSVGQSQLKTTTGVSSLRPGGGERASGTVPGGQYAFVFQTRQPSATNYSGVVGSGIVRGNDNSFVTRWHVVNEGSSAITFEVRSRYIQSSPPYDFGDGEVQGFAYILLNADGTVAGTFLAEDPPWYGNTPHAPREQFERGGKVFGLFVRPACRLCDVKAGKVSLDEYRARAGEVEVIEEEITPATKLRGMEDLPQPFFPRDGQTAVLLDPMDDLTGRLVAMMQAGESVAELFAEDYLRVNNAALTRKGPPGVAIHAARWR